MKIRRFHLLNKLAVLKKIFFIISFSIVFFISCKPIKIIERSVEGDISMFYLDFKPYLEKGFVFSSGNITQNYSPIGIIYYTVEPDIIEIYSQTLSPVTKSMVERGDGIIENGNQYIYDRSITRQTKNVNDLLETVYKDAASKGANGVIDLKYQVDTQDRIILTGSLVKIE